MNKYQIIGITGLLSIFLLSGCASLGLSREEAIIFNKHIQDIEVKELDEGIIITFKAKQGGSFTIAVPDTQDCLGGIGRKIEDFRCGKEILIAQPAKQSVRENQPETQ